MPTAPSLISYTEVSSWTTSGSPKSTASISWQTGDVIVVLAISEANDAMPVPTATGLTFSSQKSNVTASTCGMQACTAIAGSSGSGAVSMTNPNGSSAWGFGVWVFRNSAGVGNSAEQHTSTKTVSLTPTGAHSAIVWALGDFAAGALQTITPTPTDTRQRALDSGRYTFYVADLTDQASAGAVSYGISGSGSGPFSIGVVEVKGSLDLPPLLDGKPDLRSDTLLRM